MAIEGPLRELSLEDVFQLLELASKTGVLTVRSEQRADQATVHFQNGAIVFARRHRSLRRLGQQLLRAGKLTERELDAGLASQREGSGEKLGRILLEMGSVEKEELYRQLRFQLEEIVYDLMGWEEGYFRFEETSDVVADEGLRIRVESLLMEGARRIDEWSRLEPKIPSLEVTPVLASAEDEGAGPLDLRSDEWEVLAEVDGARDLRQIAADLGRSSFEVAKIVYGLVSMGVVEIEHRPMRGTREQLAERLEVLNRLLEQEDWEEVIRISGELEGSFPERSELPLLAGRALAAQGRTRAATEAFARAVGLDPLSAEANYALGFAAARVGDLERAERAWDAYLRLAGRTPRAALVERALPALRTLEQILAEEQASSGEKTSPGRFTAVE